MGSWPVTAASSFQLIDTTFVLCKFHFQPRQGVRNLTQEEAERIQAKDFNHATGDLYDAIAQGDFPEWDMFIQVMEDNEHPELDWDPLDDDPLFDDIDPLDLLMARAHGGHIDSLYVGGRAVVAGGRVTGVDEPALRAELLARTRAALAAEPDYTAWRTTLAAMAEDLGPFYRRGGLGCC